MIQELAKLYALLEIIQENAAAAQVIGPEFAEKTAQILAGREPLPGEIVHELKTWQEPFRDMRNGRKWFELRAMDRPFQVGDVLVNREWNHRKCEYTGRVLYRRVTFIMKGGEFGLPVNMCILQLAL